MRRYWVVAAAAIFVWCFLFTHVYAADIARDQKKVAGSSMKYPETRRVDQVDEFFGTQVPDHYRWL